MGVPKFYRWISERYPKINQVITDAALLPEFDHLYLDMNGIIHGCTHPSHLDVSEPLSEKEMMFGIMNYLDRLISQIVKPKVSVFLAIDGVAPRAKLNQQRSRRFRSAKDLADELKKKESPNTVENNHPGGGVAFDSNCITPGTEFMARVSETIKYFIQKKLKEDPHWRNLKVIFSGHEIPGEGEHKIMDFIREMKTQPGYKPNTRHCMYGQDADLIMLSLVTHEPHFTLLREIIDFNFSSNKNKNSLKSVKKFTKESNFQLLHISILREYLEIEFALSLGFEKNSTEYNLEAIIDDFVFMTFLIGNDFLPHLPALDIGHGAFELLFDTYKQQRSTWSQGQYLTKYGSISDPERLERFLSTIGEAESELIDKMKQQEQKQSRKRSRFKEKDEILASSALDNEELVLGELPDKLEDDPESCSKSLAEQFKTKYYKEKLGLSNNDTQQHDNLRKSYMEGLIWCLSYYYKGCTSWSWYFPYHYGPMLSDLKNLSRIFNEITFDLGEPLKPFEQLMACLPPASAILVPKPYRTLMLACSSPIIDFYPREFQVDMNGKKNPWEGVNLLPFIDVHLLKLTISTNCPENLLTPEERRRNKRGNVLCYYHDVTSTRTVPSFNRDIGIPDIFDCHSRVEILEEPKRVNQSFHPKLIPGTKIPYPGFPSLNVIPIKEFELVPVGLDCFGMASKYPTMMLSLHELPLMASAQELSKVVLGRNLFINWPLMHEAKVVSVSDATHEVRQTKKDALVHQYTEEEMEKWELESETMRQQYCKGYGVPGSGGLRIGKVTIRLKLLPLQGMKTSTKDGSKTKVFGKEEAEVPLQMVLFNAPVLDQRFIESGPFVLRDRFPTNCRVLLTKGKYRGNIGTVLDVSDTEEKVIVNVQVLDPEPPFTLAIVRAVQEQYYTSYECAKMLQLPNMVFNKITGSLFVNPGNYDLGLNLKYKQGFCVLGYSRKREPYEKKPKKVPWKTGDSLLVVGSGKSGNNSDNEQSQNIVSWEFSTKTIQLVAAYRKKYPQLFNALMQSQNNVAKYDAKQLLGPNHKLVPEVREWLNKIETAKLPRTPTTTSALDPSAITAIQKASEIRASQKDGSHKDITLKILPSMLFREGSLNPTEVITNYNGTMAPELGERIVNICANGIPFGAKGTVVGIHKASTGCVELVMDKEFVGGSTLQGACAKFRGKLALWAHLLRVSSTLALDDLKNIERVTTQIQNSNTSKPGYTQKRENVCNNGHFHQNNETGGRNFNQTMHNVSPSTHNNENIHGSKRESPLHSGRINGKQGIWREALGPPEHGIGFRKGWRGVDRKTGYDRFLEHVNKNENNKQEKVPVSKGGNINTEASSGLKAMLGVKLEPTSSSKTNPKPSVTTKDDASEDLKVMLGIPASSKPSLEEIRSAQPTHPLPPQSHTIAQTSKLLQPGMIQQQQEHGPNNTMPMVSPLSVNAPPFNPLVPYRYMPAPLSPHPHQLLNPASVGVQIPQTNNNTGQIPREKKNVIDNKKTENLSSPSFIVPSAVVKAKK